MVDRAKPAPVESTSLVGMKEIRSFLHRSEATVLKLVEQYPDSIPIRKVNGVWESDRLALGEWRREVLLGNSARSQEASPSPGGDPDQDGQNHHGGDIEPTDRDEQGARNSERNEGGDLNFPNESGREAENGGR